MGATGGSRRPSRLLLLFFALLFAFSVPAAAAAATKPAAAAEPSEAAAEQQEANEAAAAAADEEPACTTGLRDALNAAIAEMHTEHYMANELLSRYKRVPYVPVLACPLLQTPEGLWPSLGSLHPSDLLLQVLHRGVLRVATYGVPPQQQQQQQQQQQPQQQQPQQHPDGPHRAYRGFDWGEEADYSKDPPKGFFPDYLRRLVSVLGAHYGRGVSVHYMYYTSGAACLRSVLIGETDMTDIYFLQSMPDDDSLLHFSLSGGAPKQLPAPEAASEGTGGPPGGPPDAPQASPQDPQKGPHGSLLLQNLPRGGGE